MTLEDTERSSSVASGRHNNMQGLQDSGWAVCMIQSLYQSSHYTVMNDTEPTVLLQKELDRYQTMFSLSRNVQFRRLALKPPH